MINQASIKREKLWTIIVSPMSILKMKKLRSWMESRRRMESRRMMKISKYAKMINIKMNLLKQIKRMKMKRLGTM